MLASDDISDADKDRALCTALKTAKDPEAVFRKLLSLIVNEKVRLEDFDKTQTLSVDAIKTGIAKRYRNSLLRVARKLKKQHHNFFSRTPDDAEDFMHFIDVLTNLRMTREESGNKYKILHRLNRLQGSVDYFDWVFEKAAPIKETTVPLEVSRSSSPEKPLALPPPTKYRYPKVQIYTWLGVTYTASRDKITARSNAVAKGKPSIVETPKETKHRGRSFSPEHRWMASLSREDLTRLRKGPCREAAISVVPPEKISPMETYREMSARPNMRSRIVLEIVP
jgi:hypothetical protein